MATTVDINDVLPERDYTAAVGQTLFDVPFEFFSNSDLVVLVDGATQALNTDYTVTGAEVEGGGSVTFTSGLSGGEKVRIYTDIPVARDVQYQQSGDLPHNVLDRDFARIIRMLQQFERDLSRSIRLSASDAALSMELALAATRANKYLTFGASGELQLSDTISATTTFNQSTIGQNLWPRTAEEIAAGVTPTYYYYEPGNILRYGADPAGVADSFTAVDSAFKAHPGQVLVPAGTYINSTTTNHHEIASLTGLNIRGDGKGVSVLDGFTFKITTSGNYLQVKELSFNQCDKPLQFTNCAAITVEDVEFHCRDDVANRPINLFGCQNVKIRGCDFEGNVQYGVSMRAIVGVFNRDIEIDNCLFDGTDHIAIGGDGGYPAGIEIVEGDHITVTNCIFREWRVKGTSPVDSAYGIYQGDNNGLGTGNNQSAWSLTVTGCQFFNCETAGIRLHNMSLAEISGCNFDGDTGVPVRSIMIDGDDDPGDATGMPYPRLQQSNISITGNTMLKGRIIVSGVVHSLTITGNTMYDFPSEAIHLNGTSSRKIRFVSITGNTIEKCGDAGVLAVHCLYIDISGNVFIDANQNNEAAGNTDNNACIRYSGCDLTSTFNNQFINTDTTSKGAHYGVNFNTSSSVTHYYDRSNRCLDMRTSPFRGEYSSAPSGGDWVNGDYVPSMDIDFTSNPAVTGWRYDGSSWHAIYESNATWTVP